MRSMLESCVVILFIFFLPYIKSLSVSQPLYNSKIIDYRLIVLSTYRFPLAFIPVPVVPVVLALSLLKTHIKAPLSSGELPYLLVVLVVSLVFAPRGLAGVLTLPLPSHRDNHKVRLRHCGFFTSNLPPSRPRTCGRQIIN